MRSRPLDIVVVVAALLTLPCAARGQQPTSAVDSVALAKSLLDGGELPAAERILDQLLISGRVLPVRAEVRAALIAALLAVSDVGQPDSARASTFIARALRRDPMMNFSELEEEFNSEFVRWVRERQAALQIAGDLPRIGRLHLMGLPPGATVTLDGVFFAGPEGEAPADLHQLRIAAPGYRTLTDTVSVQYGQSTYRAVALEAIPLVPGTVTIATSPWAMVAIDSSPARLSPLLRVPLGSGRHRMRLERAGYLPQQTDFTVVAGQDTSLGLVTLHPDSLRPEVPPDAPLRSRILDAPATLAAAAAALDRLALDTLGPLLDSALSDSLSPRALAFLLRGVAGALADERSTADVWFARAILEDPSVQVGADDFNPDIARWFAAARDSMLQVTLAGFGPSPAMVGRETVRLALRLRFPWGVTAALRAAGGSLVWSDSGAADSAAVFTWTGQQLVAGRPSPVKNGTYQLSVIVAGRSGGRATALTRAVTIRSEHPDTLLDPGPIPDSLLVPETLGARGRWRVLLHGAAFGALALAATSASGASWLGSGLKPDARGYVVGGMVIVTGALGALLSRSDAVVPENRARNHRAREAWEAERQRRARENASRLAVPYRLLITVQP